MSPTVSMYSPLGGRLDMAAVAFCSVLVGFFFFCLRFVELQSLLNVN